jgi:predicted XRE-type DNA-binding protein
MREKVKLMKYKHFIEFCKDGDKTIEQIAEHFNITKNTAYRRVRRLNLKYAKQCQDKIIRNETILKLVKQDKLTYKEIGELFGITKQRVKSIIYKSGYSRWTIRKVKNKAIAKEVTKDLKLGLTYTEIRDKYTKKTLNRLVYNNLIPSLYLKTLEERNDTITIRKKGQYISLNLMMLT